MSKNPPDRFAYYRKLNNAFSLILGCCEMLAEDERNRESKYLLRMSEMAKEMLEDLWKRMERGEHLD